jgi:hypothetical protein
LRRILADWLTDMELIPADNHAVLDSYVGYLEPYATSHNELDKDKDFQEDVRTAAKTLAEAVKLMRAGKLPKADTGLHEARPK